MVSKGFSTLIKENNVEYSKRWKPNSIKEITNLITTESLKDLPIELSRNIAYNIQYLQYIDFQLKELLLHSVITKMLYKTFIITSVSIIEAIFYYLLKSNDKNTKRTFKKVWSTKTNEKKLDGSEVVIELNMMEKIQPVDSEMTFDTMIQIIEKTNLLDLKQPFFSYLKQFKELRNKVHIHITVGDILGTDFWEFNMEDYLFMKYILLSLLIDNKIYKCDKVPSIKGDKSHKIVPKEYLFLILSDEEKAKMLKKYK